MQVNSTSTVNAMNSNDTLSGPQQTLSQQDFLQLLVTQMQNQNPLDPQSDTQMAAEMAQFTSLQQTTAMSGSLSMLQANSLIGNTVTLQVDPQNVSTGVVSGVLLGSASSDGKPQIVVNGTAYDLNQVLTITPPSSSSTGSGQGSSSP